MKQRQYLSIWKVSTWLRRRANLLGVRTAMYTQSLNSGGRAAQRLNQHFNTNKLGLSRCQGNLARSSEATRRDRYTT